MDRWRFGPDSKLTTVAHDIKSTFLEASKFCWKEGGHLAVIRSEEDGEELYADLVKNYPEGTQFWLGASDVLSEDNWVNMADATVLEYINWMPGRPDKTEGNKNDCMEGVIQSGQILSNDVKCSEERMFVCEKPKE